MAILQVPSDFPTIAAAQAASQPGDTVVVDGAYGSETLTISVDALTLDAGSGSDLIKIALDAPELTALGSRPLTINGDDTDNTIDASATTGDIRLNGGAGDDVLSGGSGNDHIAGGLGNDQLHGGSGNDVLISYDGSPFDDHDTDVMYGGAGDDKYIVDGPDDEVHEAVGEGTDKVIAMSDFTLAAGSEVEIIQARGMVGQAITGNEFANRIIGGYTDDTLDGGGGDDVLFGNGGNDTLLGGDGDDVMYGGSGHDSFDGGTGNDTVSFAKSTYAANVDLASHLIMSDADGDFNESIVNVENLIGSNSSDILRGDGNDNRLRGMNGDDMLRGNGGNDTILGDNGNDQITGGAGSDRLTGGNGNDTFIYTSTSDSGLTTADRDIILDFLQGADKISLTQIDANTAVSGNQAFSFIGGSAFSHTAGELHQVTHGANTWIEGDMNGDGAADFQIALKGAYTLTASDFAL